MSAAPVQEFDVAPARRAAAGGRITAPCPPTGEPAAVLVTVQISVTEGELSPATSGLLEHLHGLLEHATRARVATVGERPARPRLVHPLPNQVAVSAVGAPPQFVVHEASRSVYRNRTPVPLTRREYDLFVFLARHPRRVFTRAQLLRQVWGYEPVAGERTVDVHVRRLRTKLDGYPPVVATVRGVGYRLAESVQVTVQTELELD